MGSPLVGEKVGENTGKKVGEEKVKMKKQLGLLEGVAIILGIIIGSGHVFQCIDLYLHQFIFPFACGSDELKNGDFFIQQEFLSHQKES